MRLFDYLRGVRWFPYSPQLARTFTPTGSILLCWAVWRTPDDGGPVIARISEIEAETGLTEEQVLTARGRIAGVLSWDYRRETHQTAYRVDAEAMQAAWEKSFPDGGSIREKPDASPRERAGQGVKAGVAGGETREGQGVKPGFAVERERPLRGPKKKAAGKPRTPISRNAPVPPGLSGGDFPEAWHDFLHVRAETRHPIRAKQQGLLLARLDRLRRHPRGGLGAAVALVRRSAENGWRGIFPEGPLKAAWEETELSRWAAIEESLGTTPGGEERPSLSKLTGDE